MKCQKKQDDVTCYFIKMLTAGTFLSGGFDGSDFSMDFQLQVFVMFMYQAV